MKRSLQAEHREFTDPAMLSRLLQPLSRAALQEAADASNWDKWNRKITFHPYFRMLLLLGLTRYSTLSELQAGMQDDPLFARHGAKIEVSVSGLAQVPAKRGSRPFLALLDRVMEQVAALPEGARRSRALRSNTLRSIQHLLAHTQVIDSTTFSLPPSIAKWAKKHDGETSSAGYKLHLRLAGGYGGLAQVDFSPVKDHDRPHLDPLVKDTEPGSIFLVDRGYQDYKLFERWNAAKQFFVTKLKKSHSATICAETNLGERTTESGYVLLQECRARLGSAGRETKGKYRLLDVITPDGKRVTLVTNLWDATPDQICALCQYRWTIETVFRWLKHALGLSHLISTQKEGVIIQVTMALIVYALLLLYQAGDAWSPKYLLLKIQAEFNNVLVAFGYELAQSGKPPPPEVARWLPA